MDKNAQLHELKHMEMKPSTAWVSRARYSDAKDLILLLLDDRNAGYVDAQGTGAFSLALEHPLLWTTDQSNACSQVGSAVEPRVLAHLRRKSFFTFTRQDQCFAPPAQGALR